MQRNHVQCYSKNFKETKPSAILTTNTGYKLLHILIY